MCPVPESKSVKDRVHLDVSVSDLATLQVAGARVSDDAHPWTVMTDPAGNELCAFERRGGLPDYRVFEIVVDSHDPERICRWWAGVFGVEPQHEDAPWWWLEGAQGFPTKGSYFAMVFPPVPEPKIGKNRLHWDVYGTPEEFESWGVTRLWEVSGEGGGWVMLADPEGNEFCVFADPEPDPRPTT